MDIRNKVVVVTGGASGIGRGLAIEARARGAAKVVVTDINVAEGQAVAEDIDGAFYKLDVGDPVAVEACVANIEEDHGAIGVWFSNAGILLTDAPSFDCFARSPDEWDRIWQINVHSHVHAARALVPRFRTRGGGRFVITASAAGLLSQIGDTSYSTTKHAAVGFAEAMAIAHGDEGIEVSVICPQAVESKMTDGMEASSAAIDGMLTASEMAKTAFDQIAEGRFMIRPHPQVVDYFQAKAMDYDRWVGGMRKLRRAQIAKTGQPM